jgi:hypothetical protein
MYIRGIHEVGHVVVRGKVDQLPTLLSNDVYPFAKSRCESVEQDIVQLVKSEEVER